MKGLRDDVTKGVQFGTKRNSGSFKRGRNSVAAAENERTCDEIAKRGNLSHTRAHSKI